MLLIDKILLIVYSTLLQFILWEILNYFMEILQKYEIMILLTEEFNDSELKTWVFNYAKNLRKFNVCDISVISRGKHN